MTYRTRTYDLVERVEEMEARLDEIEAEMQEIEEDVQLAMQDEGVDDPTELSEWPSFEAEWDDLDTEQTRLQGERRKFMDAIVHWQTDVDITQNPDFTKVEEAFAQVDSCEFEVQELSFGEVQEVNDDMMEKSFDVDVQREDIEGTPKQGYMQIQFLRKAIIDWPEGAPVRSGRREDKPAPGEYPDVVSEWLFDKVDAFNTTQEDDLGNSSLQDRIN